MSQEQSLVCAFCKQPFQGNHYRFRGQIACERCAEQIRNVDGMNHPSTPELVRAGGAALLAAIAAAFAWALVVKATKFESGIATIAVGWIVVLAAMKAGGGKRGVAMQVIVIVCSLLAIYLGKNLTIGWALWDDIIAKSGRTAEELRPIQIRFLLYGAITTFEPFDLLWYGIVIFGGWRRAMAIPIHLEGPFGDLPKSPPPNLQFNQAVYNQPLGNR